VVLTLGTTNAYINGAVAMAGALSRPRPASGDAADGGADAGPEPAAMPGRARPAARLLAAIAACGLLLITLYGLGLVSPASLVAIPTTLFLCVYLGCMAAAARVLRGQARWAALPAGVAVLVMLGYCGWALAVPAAAVVVAVCCGVGSCRRSMPAPQIDAEIREW
jgi:amino acid efflux transporter